MRSRLWFCAGLGTVVALVISGCSSTATTTAPSKAQEAPLGVTVASNKHPYAKYIEVGGFRIEEESVGKLKITFDVVNHGQGEIDDLALKVQLTTTAAKPGDPPIAEFDAKIDKLAPLENKDVSAIVPTKMRVYELPDWEFLKPQFEITGPTM